MHCNRRPISFAVFAFSLCASTGHAQSHKVAALEAYAKRIDRNLQHYPKVVRDLPGRSTEGGILTFYRLGSSPRKLVAQYFGESGKATEEFYFRNNRLFLMRRRNSSYDRQFGKVVSTEQTQFYFAGGKLQKGSSELRTLLKESSAKTPQPEREILDDARELLRIAKGK